MLIYGWADGKPSFHRSMTVDGKLRYHSYSPLHPCPFGTQIYDLSQNVYYVMSLLPFSASPDPMLTQQSPLLDPCKSPLALRSNAACPLWDSLYVPRLLLTAGPALQVPFDSSSPLWIPFRSPLSSLLCPSCSHFVPSAFLWLILVDLISPFRSPLDHIRKLTLPLGLPNLVLRTTQMLYYVMSLLPFEPSPRSMLMHHSRLLEPLRTYSNRSPLTQPDSTSRT